MAGVSGIVLRKDAIAAGYNDRVIARLRDDGTWHRVRHGAYVDGEVWRSASASERRKITARAVLRTAQCHSFLSHQTGAEMLGADVWELPDTVHLTRVDARGGRSEAGVTQHRGELRVGDTTVRAGIPITSGTRCALDVTTQADVEHSLVVVNSLLHLGETTKPLLIQALAAREFWPGTLHSDLVVRLADGRAESVGESRTSYLLWSQGIPSPVMQLDVYGRDGVLIGRLDFAWPELGVWLEFDGRAKYQQYRRPGESIADAVAREKRREDLIRELTGWRCIRITWADLFDPVGTAARIRAMLRGAAA